MKEKEKYTDRKAQNGMDNSEQFTTDNKTLHEMFEEEQTVDPIPLEDLKEEQREEKKGRHSKDTSSSEKKYNMDFDNNL
ncbi:hypothetical protein [Mesobacillus zeae]|uniref:Uncharacterized protein n=1 Tax=Mesobacillus zeae TaxID=1917180 RepID=A0A398BD82_9BACI|nr:hypothetical protein [Mesobacillus zeae]RID87767.1 hypothetical protein D1970_02670 [Mesobacillus zeae]